MKVLMLPAYFFPEQAASSYLGNNIRESLCERGIVVELFVPLPCRGLSKAEYHSFKKK